MKKLIIKTAAISASVIILLAAIAFLLVAITSPFTLSKIGVDCANHGFALYFAELNYQADSGENNLVWLCDRAIAAKDEHKILEYTDIALENEKIKKYIAKDHYDYFACSNVKALYSLGDEQKAIERAVALSTEYLNGNAVEQLIYIALSEQSKEFATKILNAMKSMDTSSLNERSLAIYKADLKMLEAYVA